MKDAVLMNYHLHTLAGKINGTVMFADHGTNDRKMQQKFEVKNME